MTVSPMARREARGLNNVRLQCTALFFLLTAFRGAPAVGESYLPRADSGAVLSQMRVGPLYFLDPDINLQRE